MKAPKVKSNDMVKYINNDKCLHIVYKTPYSEGVIDVDTLFYENNSKRFLRLFKDCTILHLSEVDKSTVDFKREVGAIR